MLRTMVFLSEFPSNVYEDINDVRNDGNWHEGDDDGRGYDDNAGDDYIVTMIMMVIKMLVVTMMMMITLIMIINDNNNGKGHDNGRGDYIVTMI